MVQLEPITPGHLDLPYRWSCSCHGHFRMKGSRRRKEVIEVEKAEERVGGEGGRDGCPAEIL